MLHHEAVSAAAWPLQAFVIGTDLIDACSFEEMDATWADMESMELAKPPYYSFDIIVPQSRVIRVVNEKTGESFFPAEDESQTLRVRFTGEKFEWLLTRRKTTVNLQDFVEEECRTRMKLPPDPDSWTRSAASFYKMLIVMLATKNVHKAVSICKSARLDIGRTHKNVYTTTIKVGKVTEATEGGTGGTERRPHLRRGHIRRQHYGPGNELVKRIFIEPVFVNADKGWIAERTAYNVSGVKP